ncbi:MAG: regulatory protein RecX [Candidatus Omnitrophota bacterium]
MSVLCRQAALRFLKIRPRSVAELKYKLTQKGFEVQEINQTLQWLQNVELLNDRSFTKAWINYRLARPFGFRRIITELKAKGVSDEIIEEAIACAKVEYKEHDVIGELAQRRWRRLPDIESQKKQKRVFDFLLRRGFPVDAIMKVIKNLK